ncbi:IMP dehydrogenase [Candidatus Fermentibacteria bacterium]|nr:IMP dehydrogenase [Candidatus Fermentibacteria bacterium]
MAKHIEFEPSRTLTEFRLLPGCTTEATTLTHVNLQTRLVRLARGDGWMGIKIPLVAAAMQSVSGARMGLEMARLGGLAFIFASQPIERQVEMVRRIKNYKAGFVTPETVPADMPISELAELTRRRGFATFPVLDASGVFVGLITRNDYDANRHGHLPVRDRMIARPALAVGGVSQDLREANAVLMDSHQTVLPIVDAQDAVRYLVFRKDITDHLDNPLQLVDGRKRLMAAAAVNTHDYVDRVSALVEAGVDVIAVDSSHGHSVFQERTLHWIRTHHPDLPVIGGNVITGSGFDFLVEAGACGVKVGMGGGSICITQEQKGTGRGLATAIMKVAEARDAHAERTGNYIPIIADGGIVHAKDIVVALALGTDVVMMGRYFARMDESPTEKVTINNRVMKPYWGEGAQRAREWKAVRYHQAVFAEGVEGFVEYAGKLRDNLDDTLAKIRASMSTCGVATIEELHSGAELELVSALSIREGQVHDIHLPGPEALYGSTKWGD